MKIYHTCIMFVSIALAGCAVKPVSPEMAKNGQITTNAIHCRPANNLSKVTILREPGTYGYFGTYSVLVDHPVRFSVHQPMGPYNDYKGPVNPLDIIAFAEAFLRPGEKVDLFLKPGNHILTIGLILGGPVGAINHEIFVKQGENYCYRIPLGGPSVLLRDAGD